MRSWRYFRGVTVEAASAGGVGATAITVMAMIEVGITIGARRLAEGIQRRRRWGDGLAREPRAPGESRANALMKAGAAAAILCHNHPSGDPAPSRQDIELTARLRAVSDLCGIADPAHVVVAPAV